MLELSATPRDGETNHSKMGTLQLTPMETKGRTLADAVSGKALTVDVWFDGKSST
jgi:hypothetical protein